MSEAATASGPDIHLTTHATERWIERICCEQDDIAPWDLPAAFAEAVPVGVPDYSGRGRLHPPTGAVILYTHDWRRGPPVLITVLFADKMTLNDDHLKVCTDCGLRYDPRGPCSWCPSEAP